MRDYAAFLQLAPLPPAGAPAFATVGVQFPVFLFDGTTNYTVASPGTFLPDAVLVQAPVQGAPEDGALLFTMDPLPPGRAFNWTWDPSNWVPSRNGILAPAFAETAVQTQNPTLSYSLAVIPWQSL